MFKRQTSKPRRRSRSQILEVRVMSPRIVWFGFLRIVGKLAKIACLLAILGGIGWGCWLGIQQAFYKNPDFRLQVIDLNPNPVIDEGGVAEVAEINLTGSLFDIDVDAVTAKLKAMPAIREAHVERHLPGKLVVRVSPRTPRAWISCPEAGLQDTRGAGAMLVDQDGVAYPCPELQLESAANLPCIQLPSSEEHPIQPGGRIPHPELAHCFRLLESARAADPDAIHWIDSVKQVNAWSLLLVTREGISATFGLGDHERQIASLRAAMDHSGEEGYDIATINLIPKHNIPITLRTEATPPRAVPIAEPTAGELREQRRSSDLKTLLNRN
ncbi:FtsQ-type POTRA domain-containing protein [Luteolibacter yonseiensis]|uniref:FtsQ-type POTRA domain-containing protein n=1 Tax=Luteolibacter yonseiensis TaxID=1144680 RepID=A0A934V6A3_9BACT|nr:FtsQ-type POTRA domain-containing protein [Luteolibacter yonseiensis]MBK1814807.1 FtsQ-type POTRA domain-containing protein [Luteolibacter yonseiensis]